VECHLGTLTIAKSKEEICSSQHMARSEALLDSMLSRACVQRATNATFFVQPLAYKPALLALAAGWCISTLTVELGAIMRQFKSKKLPRALALPCALTALSLPGLAFAQAQGACQGLAQAECRGLVGRNVYALTPNNVITRLHGSKAVASTKITGIDGMLIGLDYRPSQNTLYGLTDTGKIYTIAISGSSSNGATLVGTLGASFDGGVQALADFNPVVDALRVIGSNDQNFAVVNANGGNLNQTVPQSLMSYALGDVQAGIDPNLTAGAYNNNAPGATSTIFYALDYARDTMVTIADLTATGSSNTGGGKLKTIGKVVDPQGNVINIQPMAGIDIYTDAGIGNAAIISNGRLLYYVNLATVNTALPLGTTQNVVARPLVGAGFNPFIPVDGAPDNYVDVAAAPVASIANPADLVISVTAVAATQGTMLDPEFFGWDRGKSIKFTVTVTNQGPDTSNAVIAQALVFPFNDPFAVSTQGSCTVVPYAFPQYGKDISCSIGNLAPGASATITITATRTADQYATAFEVTPNFTTADGNGQIFGVVRADPDTTNNNTSKKVIINR
jgi:hypothetical protein